MPRRPHPKRTPPPHLTLIDTSVLWHPDKTVVVSPEFDSTWAELSLLSDLTLGIPEPVRDELLFQQTSSALKSLKKVHDEVALLSRLTGASPGTGWGPASSGPVAGQGRQREHADDLPP